MKIKQVIACLTAVVIGLLNTPLHGVISMVVDAVGESDTMSNRDYISFNQIDGDDNRVNGYIDNLDYDILDTDVAIPKAVCIDRHNSASFQLISNPICEVIYLEDAPKLHKTISQNYYSSGVLYDEFLNKCNSNYGYFDMEKRTSSDGRKKLYDALMEDATALWKSNADISKSDDFYIINSYKFEDYLTSSEAIEVYYTFKNDNPLFYFASNTIIISEGTLFFLTCSEYATANARNSIQEEVKSYVENYEDVIIENNTYGSLLNIHDKLNNSMVYVDNGMQDNHNIVGAVVYGEGVCEAYARTYQLLLNYYGFDNYVVTGTAAGVDHIWNIVKMDDNYYYIDCTFDDSDDCCSYFMFGLNKIISDRTINSPDNTEGLFLCALPTVSDTDFIVPEDVEYVENGLIYSISYSGRAILTGYSDLPNDVIIPKVVNNAVVTEVGKSAFDSCSSLTSIQLPSSIKEIGEAAFANCSSLASINLPEGIEFVGQCAITNTRITSLHIPASLAKVGASPFSNNHYLKTITVEKNNRIFKTDDDVLYHYDDWMCVSIDFMTGCWLPVFTGTGWAIEVYPEQKSSESYKVLDETILASGIHSNFLKKINIQNAYFSGIPCEVEISESNEHYISDNGIIYSKDGSKLVHIPSDRDDISILDSTTIIDSGAFSFCEIESIELPDNITTINSDAFWGSKIQSIVLPGSIKQIGDNAFRACKNLEHIEFPNSIEELPAAVCMDCVRLRSVKLPEGIEAIPFQAFCDTACLETINFPNSLKKIGINAFSNSGIHEIQLPEGLEKIEAQAFMNCNSLYLVSFPETLKTIEAYTFGECDNLRYIRFEGDLPELAEDIFEDISDSPSEELIINYPEKYTAYTNIGNECFECEKEVELRAYSCNNHHYTQKKIAATCTERGHLIYHCEDCNDTFEVFEYNLVENYEIIDENSTSCSYRSIFDNAPLGHECVYVPALEPTTEKSGNIEYWICKRCGKMFSDEYGNNELSDEEIEIPQLIEPTTNPDTTTTTMPVTITITTKPITTTTTTKPTTTTTNPDNIQGDINNDGKIEVTDIVLLKKCLIYKSRFTEYQFNAADINKDGKVNVLDFIIMKRILIK